MQRSRRIAFTLMLAGAIGLALNVAAGTHRAGKPKNTPGQRTASRRAGQSETLMPDGNMLLIGGETNESVSSGALLVDGNTGVAIPLNATLRIPRAWHTATLLPDGSVLVIGGMGANGKALNQAELFDPVTQAFQIMPPMGLDARAYHTATLLITGDVLIAGGLNPDGETLGTLELWNFATKSASVLPQRLLTPRSRQNAFAMADGSVLLWGGINRIGMQLNDGERLDPISESVAIVTSFSDPAREPQPPELAASIPLNNSTDVPTDSALGVRFSKPIAVTTATTSTVTLGTGGKSVPASITPAEGGMLLFVIPAEALQPNTEYAVSMSGISDKSGQPLPDAQISFTTNGSNDNPGSGQGEVPLPSPGSQEPPDPLNSPWRKLPALKAKPGVTALSGQVLSLNGEPLRKISIEVDSSSVKTDKTGRFLLKGITAGHHSMWVDGSTASTRETTYGLFEIGVDITDKTTNVLSYTIWMPVLDMAHAMTIPSPTTSDTIVTTPLIAGLELHIPANSTITDRNGKTVTTVSITPIPVNQPPFPLPTGVLVPTYFTIQPGGAYIAVNNGGKGPQGGQLFYPNTYRYPPNTPYNFYDYDPDSKGWYVYGQGQVNAVGNQVIPNPGTYFYEFSGAMVSNPVSAPPKGPKAGNPARGEPVDLQTGLFIYSQTDLELSDVIPLALTRIYRPDDLISRAFGIGATHPYDMYIVGDDSTEFPEGYTYVDLILPDGGRIHFVRTDTCGGSICSIGNLPYLSSSTPGPFYGATLAPSRTTNFNAWWVMTMRDGMQLYFPDSEGQTVPQRAALVGAQDRNGNALTFTRDGNANLVGIQSPNGRWIHLTLDSNNRITVAQDNTGRAVNYAYNPTGYLSRVTDADGGVTVYNYDASGDMTTVTDPRGTTYLTNEYDGSGRVTRQTLGDGGVFQFSYQTDSIGNILKADVTDPRGIVETAQFNSDGFMTVDIKAVGLPEQESFTYTRQQESGLILSAVDALNRETDYTYDSLGNVTSVTSLAGSSQAATTYFSYQPQFSEVASITDPLLHTISFGFDANGDATDMIDPLGDVTSAVYNQAGQASVVISPAGEFMAAVYNSGDLAALSDALARTTALRDDGAGRLVSVTNPLGQTTSVTYNNRDEVVSITDALSSQITLTYDGDGNPLTVRDPNGNTTVYTYDAMDRIKTRTDALGKPETYSYDLDGNLISFTDRRGKTTVYGYDNLNRRTFIGFGAGPGPSYESSISYEYDSGSRLTNANDSISGPITLGYDGFDRVTSQATPEGAVSYTYDSAGRRSAMAVAGQQPVSYSFDAANRLTRISSGSSSVVLGYDADGRRTSLQLPGGVSVSTVFDGASEVSEIDYASPQGSLGNLVYSYDLAGQVRQTSGTNARTALPLPISNSLYNANNQLVQWGTATPTYDLNGNVLTDGTNTYTWDARNRLVSMNMGGATFQYDGLGRRVSRSMLGGTVSYLYDGSNPIQELNGSTVTANMLTGYLDEYFVRADSNGLQSILTNSLGSTIALTDQSGSGVAQLSYEPFGNTVLSGTSSNPYQFVGRENDGSGVYFFRNRYYSPGFGRFLSEDPIGIGGGINLYSYVSNDPILYSDPFGTDKGSKCDHDSLYYANQMWHDTGRYNIGVIENGAHIYPDKPWKMVQRPLEEIAGDTMVKGLEGVRNPLYPSKPSPFMTKVPKAVKVLHDRSEDADDWADTMNAGRGIYNNAGWAVSCAGTPIPPPGTPTSSGIPMGYPSPIH